LSGCDRERADRRGLIDDRRHDAVRLELIEHRTQSAFGVRESLVKQTLTSRSSATA